jgi:sterol desaturase/sphingolipid hydroxylase (fatty acid hydroxylase superfamily)
VPGQKTVRAGFVTDCLFWLWTGIGSKAITFGGLVIALVPLAYLYGIDPKALREGHGILATQPLWLQGIEIFVVGDFFGYWQHRLFHHRTLWPFHAIHHSSRELDWLSSTRLHPVNEVLSKIIIAVPLVVLGFNTTVTAAYIPFTTFYAIMVHANLDWDLGPFRAVFTSPTFHRWHHTKASEGLDKNFAGGLPVWDILFGTYFMPRRQPQQFGIDDPVPEGFLAQMIYPFRRRADGAASPAPALAAE